MSAPAKKATAQQGNGPKKPAAKKPGDTTQLNRYDEELAALAAQGVQTEANVGGGIKTITVKSAQFYYGDDCLGTTLRLVALDHALENAYYKDDYDSNNPLPPDCFSLGRVEDELRPHDNCAEKHGGEDGRCATCPLNAFGSAEKGGKACKNTRRILVLLESALGEDIKEATLAFLKPSVTNIKHWAAYVKSLKETANKATIQVVTEVTVRPDPKNQYVLSFKPAKEVDKKLVPALLEKRRENERVLFEPYQPVSAERRAQAAAKSKGKGGSNAKYAAGGGKKAPAKKPATQKPARKR